MNRREIMCGVGAGAATALVGGAATEAVANVMNERVDSKKFYARKVVLFEREDGWFDVDPDFPSSAHMLGHLSRIEIEGVRLIPIPEDARPFLVTEFGMRNGTFSSWHKISPEVAEAFSRSWWASHWVVLSRRAAA